MEKVVRSAWRALVVRCGQFPDERRAQNGTLSVFRFSGFGILGKAQGAVLFLLEPRHLGSMGPFSKKGVAVFESTLPANRARSALLRGVRSLRGGW